MKFRNRAVLLLPIALLLCLPMLAQTTASLTGEATTDGAPLPGVQVTISSPAMQGTRTAVTGENGGYYFGALPPGKYQVKFELEGMVTVTRTADIGVAQTGRANADMRLSAVAEAVTVTAAAPSVLETSEVTTNVSGELVEELPIQRTILAAALIAPGVNDNTPSASQLSISGSPGYDNLVMVNGVVITESVRSQALELYIEDAVQETTILTGAVSAEFGRFTGGVVNSITKSGGNEFTGSLRDSFTNPSWTEKTPWPTQADPVDVTNEVYEGTLGGYILRDRLWFFGAGRTTETSTEFFMRGIPGTNISNRYVQATNNDKYEIKLTGQITQKHSLIGAYYDEDAQTSNSTFNRTITYDLESLTDRADPKELISGFYNGVFTDRFLIEARYSEMEYGIGHGSGSKNRDVVLGTIVRNRADGNARFNSPTFCGVCDKEYRNNDSMLVKGSYFLSTPALGSHSITGGFDSFSDHRYSNNYQSGSDFRLFVNSVQYIDGVFYPTINPGTGGSATYLVWTPIFVGANFSDLQTDALFINDRWDLNQYLSFNLGVRYDKNDAVDGLGNTVSDDDRISPRLSATWDVQGNGRHRFSASYADYVSRIVEGPATAASSAGNPAYIEFMYNGPAINPTGTPTNALISTHQALEMVFAWFNSQGGTDNLNLLRAGGFRDVPGYGARISDTLASPYVREYTLGYGVQIGSNALIKIDGIMRDWEDFYAYRVDQSTPQETDFLNIGHDIQIVENTSLITREYRGVQLQSAWRPNFLRQRMNLGLNYTWATLKGNDEQESATSGTIGNNPGSIYYPEFLDYDRRQPEGYLLQDQRHRARGWVSYDIPVGFAGDVNLSLLHNYDSGLPYSAVGSIDVDSYAGAPSGTALGYETAPGTGQYYFSDRGEFRLPDIHRTDLAVNWNIPIWRVNLSLQGELLNLFENDDLISVNTAMLASGNNSNFAAFNPFTTDPGSLIECPQGTAVATCRTMGAHWQKGANFGKATGPTNYQTPQTYRFSVVLRY